MHQIILIIIKDVCGLGEGSAQKLNDNTFSIAQPYFADATIFPQKTTNFPK